MPPQPIVIPRLGEAIARERLIRDAAFLTVDRKLLTESIAGFEVHMMNLRHYTALRIAKNPFVLRGEPGVAHLIQFIWTVSVDYRPSRKHYVKWVKNSGLIDPAPPRIRHWSLLNRWANRMSECLTLQVEAAKGVHQYLSETFQDRPPVKAGEGFNESFYSDACFWSATLAREYGVPLMDVLEMPLKQIFQYLKEIKDHHGKRDTLTNPSRELIAQWQAAQQRN
jgi:hypothetical protein